MIRDKYEFSVLSRWMWRCLTGSGSPNRHRKLDGAKPTSSRWPAVQRRRATTTGPCGREVQSHPGAGAQCHLYAEPYDPQRPVVCFDETSSCWRRPGPLCRPGLDFPCGRTTNTWPGGGIHQCAGWWMKPIRNTQHPPRGVAVRDVPSGRCPADCETAGVPLHPEARELVEYGKSSSACAFRSSGYPFRIPKRSKLHRPFDSKVD